MGEAGLLGRPDPAIGAVRAMVRWVEATPLPWEGTVTDLLEAVKGFNRAEDPFPASAKGLGKVLTRATPLLGRLGLEVRRPWSGNRRLVRVSRRG